MSKITLSRKRKYGPGIPPSQRSLAERQARWNRVLNTLKTHYGEKNKVNNSIYSTDQPVSGNDSLHQSYMKALDSTPQSSKCWAANDRVFQGVSATYDILPSGVYRCEMSQNGPILRKQIIETDDLIEIADTTSEKIIEEFKKFWTLEEEYTKRGFMMKRGFLIWGDPGSGKTSSIQLLSKHIRDDLNGLVIFIDNPETASRCLQMIRNIEPNRPLIAILEDLDALIENYSESEYLALLDGEAQIKNIVFVATSNYPERLDIRFVDRPSRFDTVWKVDMPDENARRKYLEFKEPSLTSEEIDQWVAKTDGFSMAHLKEVIISVKCFGKSLDEVIGRINDMREKKPKSSDAKDGGNFGFLGKMKRDRYS